MKKFLIAILTLLVGVFSSVADEKVPFEGYFVLFSKYEFGVHAMYNDRFAHEDLTMPITDIIQFNTFYFTCLGDRSFDQSDIQRKCVNIYKDRQLDSELLFNFKEKSIYPDSSYRELKYVFDSSIEQAPYFRFKVPDDDGRPLFNLGSWVYQIAYIKGTASQLPPDSKEFKFIKKMNYISASNIYYVDSIESIDNFVGLDFFEAWVPGFDCDFNVSEDNEGRDDVEGLLVEIYDKESVENYNREDFRHRYLRVIDKEPEAPKAVERFFVEVAVPDTCESQNGYIADLVPDLWRMNRIGVDTMPFQLTLEECDLEYKSADKMASMLVKQAFSMAPYLHVDWVKMPEMDDKLVKLVYIKGKSETLPYNGKNPRIKVTSIQKYNPYIAVRSLMPHNMQFDDIKF